MKESNEWGWPEAIVIMFFIACVTAVILALVLR